jgi:SAM-dependent methyltransferase
LSDSSEAKPTVQDNLGELPNAARAETVVAVQTAEKGSETAIDLAASYDEYYGTGLYAQRYPRPNPNMTRLILGYLPPGGRALDFGCGNGRYLGPLLAAGAQVIAYDISEVALRGLNHRQPGAMATGRLRPVGGTLDDLMAAVPEQCLDLVVMIFGVLGHIRGGATRLDTLRRLSRLIRPGGHLVATVPNAARRFAAEQTACTSLIACGDLEPGDILYQRHSAEGPVVMYYHLFTPDRFAELLEAADLEVKRFGAESMMPERAVLGLPLGALLDRGLMKLWPWQRAYGFTAVATPRGQN